MNWLPTDLPSFLWGAVLADAAAFGTGFFKKVGEKAFSALESKLNPKPPEPVEVERTFQPTRFQATSCAWVNELKLYDYEAKGFTYYPHPRGDARCFRVSSDGRRSFKEYLMVGPGVKRIG